MKNELSDIERADVRTEIEDIFSRALRLQARALDECIDEEEVQLTQDYYGYKINRGIHRYMRKKLEQYSSDGGRDVRRVSSELLSILEESVQEQVTRSKRTGVREGRYLQ